MWVAEFRTLLAISDKLISPSAKCISDSDCDFSNNKRWEALTWLPYRAQLNFLNFQLNIRSMHKISSTTSMYTAHKHSLDSMGETKVIIKPNFGWYLRDIKNMKISSYKRIKNMNGENDSENGKHNVAIITVITFLSSPFDKAEVSISLKISRW
jgi:hypothetical protein